LELPAADRPVHLLGRDPAGFVVAHRALEVDGLLLIVGPLLLVGDDLALDGVDDDLVIGAFDEHLDVPLPGPGIFVVVVLDGVESALACGLLRCGDRVLGAHRQGLAAPGPYSPTGRAARVTRPRRPSSVPGSRRRRGSSAGRCGNGPAAAGPGPRRPG